MDYGYIRYYWYGCHPYYWCGYYHVAQEVQGDTYNYYTYNYYYDNDGAVVYEPVQTWAEAQVEGLVQPAVEPSPPLFSQRR